MKRCIILFGADPMTAAMARGRFQTGGLEVVVPDRRAYLKPLSYFVGEGPDLPAPEFRGNFPEPVVVLCGLEQELDEMLRQLGQVRLGPGVLKAVLTPYNRQWNAVMLLRELQKERTETSKV